jgi:hypothetical protein
MISGAEMPPFFLYLFLILSLGRLPYSLSASTAANPATAKMIAGRFVPTAIIQVRSDCFGFFLFSSLDLSFHHEHLLLNFNH